MICVAESTVNDAAAVPLNDTADAFVKFVPVIVTLVPAGPVEGVKLAIVGAATNPNEALDVAVPPGVVTEIVPLVVPGATTAVICVNESTEKLAAGVPLNWTTVAPVRFVPVIVTLVPVPPLPGRNPPIVGAGMMVKLPAEVAVPPGVVTDTVPLVVPAATTAVICVAESTENDAAAVPWNETADAFVKAVPVIVTLVPASPLVGVKLEIAGAAITVKAPADVARPPDVVTEMVPLVVPEATTAVI